MTWQLLLAAYLVLGTVVALLQRRLGRTIPQHNRLANGFFFVCVHYPLGLILAAILGFHLDIGWFNFFTLAVMGISFPLTDMLIFRASKDVDAGLVGILNNLTPVITIALAALLLSERLSGQQLIGALIIAVSALAVSIITYEQGSKSRKTGIMLALLSITLLGLGTVYETWILKRIGMGSVLIYGQGLQTFWMAVFAWPYRHGIKQIINRKYGAEIVTWAFSKSLKGFAFLGALTLSKSAAIVGAFTGFLPVMVVLAAYFVLKERSYLRVKIIAAAAGAVGLVILSLG
ncbi:MAG TPA: EamA family transporter [Candidatus Saccharimonadales bacterium]